MPLARKTARVGSARCDEVRSEVLVIRFIKTGLDIALARSIFISDEI